MVRHPATPYVAPFALFLILLAVQDHNPLTPRWEQGVRVCLIAASILIFSRRVLDFRVWSAVATIALGVAVFAIWIAPDVLLPDYRQHWLFQNSITGQLKTSIDASARSDPWVLVFRTIRAVVLVPILEELFWRGWLMRWLVNEKFELVKLGTYTPRAFWVTAVLFAVEHGPYWEVGFIAGVAYNWWIMRTRSLGDCILAHAVTNAVLSAYVLAFEKWEYWM